MKCLLDRLETLDGKEEIGVPIDFMLLLGFPENNTKNMTKNVRKYFDVIYSSTENLDVSHASVQK